MLQSSDSPVGSRRAPEFQDRLHGAPQSNRGQSHSHFHSTLNTLIVSELIFMYKIYPEICVLHSIRVRERRIGEKLWSDKLCFKRREKGGFLQPCEAKTTE